MTYQTQQDFDRLAAEIVRDERYLIAEAVAEVQSEPARPDYSLAALMGLEGNSGRSTP